MDSRNTFVSNRIFYEKKCKVSVLVPIYNVEKYLRQCLDSLHNQTLQDMEFVCVNDGSLDSSLLILQEYQQRDGRFHVIDKENSGYGDSMNIALLNARGEYIGILESDDYAESNMYELLYQKAVKFKADMVRCNYYRHGGGQDIYNEVLPDEYAERETPFSAWEDKRVLFISEIWNGLYRRAFLEENDIRFLATPGASYQDTSFRYKTAMCAKRIAFENRPLIYYRVDNANSSIHAKGKVYAVCDEYHEVERFLACRADLATEFSGWITYCKYSHGYEWNWKRIMLSEVFDFMKYIASEFCFDDKNGKLIVECWPTLKWKAVHELMRDYVRFTVDMVISNQNKYLLMYGFINVLRQYSKIFIYGAGKVGSQVVKYLNLCDVKVEGYIITNASKNTIKKNGLPIFSINEISDKNAMILVAVGEELQTELVRKLYSLEIDEFIIMTRELRESIAEKLINQNQKNF